MKKGDLKNKIYIHVKAESEVLGINAIVPESKCVKVLEDLRDNFLKLKDKYKKHNDRLIVKTCVHNPTLL